MSNKTQQTSLSHEDLTFATKTPIRPDVPVCTHGDCKELKWVYAKEVTLPMLLTNKRKLSVDGVDFGCTGAAKMAETT